MTRRKRRTFTNEFKEKVVKLHLAGKSRSEIVKEYDLTPSAFDKWVRQHKTSGSFNGHQNKKSSLSSAKKINV